MLVSVVSLHAPYMCRAHTEPFLLFPPRVIFKVKSSKRSNNGTDVGSGQIPEILYRIPEMEKETGFQIQLLDKSFSTTVSAVCD